MQSLIANRRTGNLVGFIVCALLMAYALYAQYVMHLEPCPLCIFQRIAVMAVGVVFLLAALQNPKLTGARIYGVLIFIAALAGMAVSARHIWIQAQPPGTVAACGASLDYLIQIMSVTEVIGKVFAGSGECARIEWRLLGLSMPWWVLFALIALLIWAAIVNFARPARELR
jgi:disulfide bond formation protein DsbB